MRSKPSERKLGEYWERQFEDILKVCDGYSAYHNGTISKDRVMLCPTGEKVYVQIRHKQPFNWPHLGRYYGYEQYRLNWDLEKITNGHKVIYAVHDYTEIGRDCKTNRLQDWFLQDIEYLSNNIDFRKVGPTYYGESSKLKNMLICYWFITRFTPVTDFLQNHYK